MSSTLRILLILVAAVAIAACTTTGASPSAAPASEPPASEAPESEAPESEAPASEEPSDAAALTALALADSDFGKILTDDAGMTLYGFTPDVDGVPTCYDGCAEAWPPVIVGDTAGINLGEGVQDGLLSTVERTDGSVQLVFGDWPLYYFANDAAAGDANGQGQNEVWFVIGGDGALIKSTGAAIEY